VWYRYGSPQSLNLLIYKRFVGAKSGSVDDIQPHMDELDDLEDVYFGRRKVKDEMERAKLRGLYEYVWMLKPPSEPEAHVPFNLMANLARVAPKGSEAEFIREKLDTYGYLKSGDRSIGIRIRRALNWVEDFEEMETRKVDLTPEQANALQEVILALGDAGDEDGYQGVVFKVARAEGMRPGNLFRVLYRILIGSDQGPRFGPYVASVGKEGIIEELEKSLGNA
jgi:lysyl-tRNA synthetase class 1